MSNERSKRVVEAFNVFEKLGISVLNGTNKSLIDGWPDEDDRELSDRALRAMGGTPDTQLEWGWPEASIEMFTKAAEVAKQKGLDEAKPLIQKAIQAATPTTVDRPPISHLLAYLHYQLSKPKNLTSDDVLELMGWT
jgi:hypothetical protein